MSRAQDIAAALNTAMGAGTVRLGSDPSLVVKYLPTGCLPVDVILGGGLPRGRSVEIFGGFSTLKSYIGLRAVATTQASGGTCAIIDTEHAFDPEWATLLGVNVGELIVQHPDTGEQGIMILTTLIQNQVDLVVVDSVAALLPKAYAEAKPGEDQQPARLAALMSKGMQRITASNASDGTALLFINQTRTNVAMTFGPKEAPPGGRALPFYASMRVRFSRAGRYTRDVKVDDSEKMVSAKEVTAYKIKAELDKSKLNRPHREVWFKFDLETGTVDELNFLISQGIESGVIIEQAKARWAIPEIMEGTLHGRAKLREWIEDDEEVVTWLREKIMETHLSV